MCCSHSGYILTRISKNNEYRKLSMAIVGESWLFTILYNTIQYNTIQYNIVYFQHTTQLHHNSNVYPTLEWLQMGWTEE